LAGEAILSRPGRAYLGNQLIPRDPHALGTAALRGGVAADQDQPKGLRIRVRGKFDEPSYGGPS
jgi:hypothetical protein